MNILGGEQAGVLMSNGANGNQYFTISNNSWCWFVLLGPDTVVGVVTCC
jgi:hypothetical protein